MHRLSDIDPVARTAVCSVCGPTKVSRRGEHPSGRLKCVCMTTERARQARQRKRRKPYRQGMGDACERCGFEAEHPSQLDVHHVDGDHSNDDPSNRRTLCANCHRLVHRAPELV